MDLIIYISLSQDRKTKRKINKKVVDITVHIPYNEIKKGGEKMKNSRIELRVSQEEKEKIDKEAEKENRQREVPPVLE